jgi:Domain of unknown function (DUF4178)
VTVPQPHGASCPNCGAPVRYLWAQAVQTTCAYCRSVLVRRDLDLERVGLQADFPVTGSPIQIGTEGKWRGKSFVVVGRITYAWARGRWNEWHCVLNDGLSAWLSDAQLEYAMTMVAEPRGKMPELRSTYVGDTYVWYDVSYQVANILEATYIGTEGDLPFFTYRKDTSTFIDLQNDQGGFATVDGTESPPLLYLGEYVTFDDLALKNLREFEGW